MPPTETIAISQPDNVSSDEMMAALFDPVTVASLEIMFPADGKWEEWAARAHVNHLKDARSSRAMFNPYLAALWFLKQGRPGWFLERCYRVLGSNLPARTRHEKIIFTGKSDY